MIIDGEFLTEKEYFTRYGSNNIKTKTKSLRSEDDYGGVEFRNVFLNGDSDRGSDSSWPSINNQKDIKRKYDLEQFDYISRDEHKKNLKNKILPMIFNLFGEEKNIIFNFFGSSGAGKTTSIELIIDNIPKNDERECLCIVAEYSLVEKNEDFSEAIVYSSDVNIQNSTKNFTTIINYIRTNTSESLGFEFNNIQEIKKKISDGQNKSSSFPRKYPNRKTDENNSSSRSALIWVFLFRKKQKSNVLNNPEQYITLVIIDNVGFEYLQKKLEFEKFKPPISLDRFILQPSDVRKLKIKTEPEGESETEYWTSCLESVSDYINYINITKEGIRGIKFSRNITDNLRNEVESKKKNCLPFNLIINKKIISKIYSIGMFPMNNPEIKRRDFSEYHENLTWFKKTDNLKNI